jgi:hypothetical protein
LRLNRNRSGHVAQPGNAARGIRGLAPSGKRGTARGRCRLLARRIG